MYKKIKSEWKTYDEMDNYEQVYFRIHEGWKTYPKRIRSMKRYTGRVYEYLVDTWEKEEE